MDPMAIFFNDVGVDLERISWVDDENYVSLLLNKRVGISFSNEY